MARMKAAWYQRFDMMVTDNLRPETRTSVPIGVVGLYNRKVRKNRCPLQSMSNCLCPNRAESYRIFLKHLPGLAVRALSQDHVFLRSRRITSLRFTTESMPRSSMEQAFKDSMRGLPSKPPLLHGHTTYKPSRSPKDMPVASPSAR